MDFFTKYPEATYGLLGTLIGSLITTIAPFAYEKDFGRTIKRVEDWQTTHAESQHHLMEELNASLKERK